MRIQRGGGKYDQMTSASRLPFQHQNSTSILSTKNNNFQRSPVSASSTPSPRPTPAQCRDGSKAQTGVDPGARS